MQAHKHILIYDTYTYISYEVIVYNFIWINLQFRLNLCICEVVRRCMWPVVFYYLSAIAHTESTAHRHSYVHARPYMWFCIWLRMGMAAPNHSLWKRFWGVHYSGDVSYFVRKSQISILGMKCTGDIFLQLFLGCFFPPIFFSNNGLHTLP